MCTAATRADGADTALPHSTPAASPDGNEPPECRICKDSTPPFVSPCLCRGTLDLVHRECLAHWRRAGGARAERRCEVCLAEYVLVRKGAWWAGFLARCGGKGGKRAAAALAGTVGAWAASRAAMEGLARLSGVKWWRLAGVADADVHPALAALLADLPYAMAFGAASGAVATWWKTSGPEPEVTHGLCETVAWVMGFCMGKDAWGAGWAAVAGGAALGPSHWNFEVADMAK
ncbi:hypothetical protein DFJ74DRAFT_703471 [Hyaloraphidium curvatum]|nr:hypothetical protein DFJ74DRAFT_703471 [Hyaloraphidium curvatum]